MSTISNIEENHIVFDEDKFVDVVHFVCDRFSHDPDKLGQVKLHKILYYADMQCFLSIGTPLTGVDYLRQPFGPTARFLKKAVDALRLRGAVETRQRDFFGYRKMDFVSKLKPQSNRLSEYEIELLSYVSDWIAGLTASEASEMSHDLPWQKAKPGGRIPYSSAIWMIPRSFPSESTIAWAQSAAAELMSKQLHESRPN